MGHRMGMNGDSAAFYHKDIYFSSLHFISLEFVTICWTVGVPQCMLIWSLSLVNMLIPNSNVVKQQTSQFYVCVYSLPHSGQTFMLP